MTSFLLLDTCVWITVSQEPQLRKVLDQLEANVAENRVKLLVPEVIKVEFARNKPSIVKRHCDHYRTLVKHARELIPLMDGDKQDTVKTQIERAATNALTQTNLVTEALVRAEALMSNGNTIALPVSDKAQVTVIERALKKQAPFHRAKNSVADALIVECFHEFLLRNAVSDGSDAFFVTENTSDLSAPNNPTLPHVDYSHIVTAQCRPSIGLDFVDR
jgi:PIN domain